MEQNKVRTYLLYAFGEIALVMIGILLALQVNNWNEERKDKALESSYLERLKDDAQWNIEALEDLISGYRERSAEILTLSDYLENPSADFDEEQLWLISRNPNFIQAWRIRNATYNELNSTGALKVLQDIRLRELLDEVESYYAFSNLQLEYWRDISVSQGSEFLPYVENQTFGSGDSVRVRSRIDPDRIKNKAEVANKLRYWSNANIIFAQGVGHLMKLNKDVLARIECLKAQSCEDS